MRAVQSSHMLTRLEEVTSVLGRAELLAMQACNYSFCCLQALSLYRIRPGVVLEQ